MPIWHPFLFYTVFAGACFLTPAKSNAQQSQQTPQARVAETATNLWRSFSNKPPVVRSQADVERLSETPAEYSKCSVINSFWSQGVQGSPPSGARSSDTCKWPKVAYYCLMNGQKLPNLPSCKESQKDEVWDRAPWSAAFVSYVFRNAGAGSNFAYSGSHSTYIIQAIRAAKGESSNTPDFVGYSIKDVAPSVGDLVCAPRGKAKGMRFEEIPLSKGSAFQSHCDIVVSVGASTIELVGGNVGDTVAKTIVKIDPKGHIIVDQPAFRNWFVVIKNRMKN